MSNTYAYIAQSDVEAAMGGVNLTPNGQAIFTTMLPYFMDVIDQYCNRTWNFVNPVIDTFDALSSIGPGIQSNYQFFVTCPNISKTPANVLYPNAGGVISVQIGGSYLDMNYIAAYNSFVKLAASFPSVILANPLCFKMVTITYNSDAARNFPAAAKLAMAQWMARFIQESPDAGKETQQVIAGTVQARYTADKVPGIPNLVKMILDQYRLHAMDRL